MSQQESLSAVLGRLRADQRQRWLVGDRKTVESYLLDRPELAADPEVLLDFIYSEFRLHQQLGEKPDPDSYFQRFPGFVAQLKPLFELDLGLAPLATTLPWRCKEPDAGRSDAAAFSLPRMFGGYELLAEIGRGAMGVVFKARQIGVERTVALKMIRTRFATAHEVERFYVEAKAAGRLKHVGIVSVIEVGAHAGEHFISMEMVEGQSLAARLAAGPLALDEAARLVGDVAAAVQYAHEQGVIHRDLKPNNILVSSTDGRPVVADFGLAKIVDAESALTAGDYIIGTPGYMAPEQASGGQIGPHSDIYALGGILYCLLTGRPPFQASSAREILGLSIESRPTPPKQLRPEVPRDLETICLKCLAKDPCERYRSASDLADDLGRFLRAEPIRARPISALERLIRTIKLPRLGPEFRHWEMPMFLAAAVMLVASLLTAFAPTIGTIVFYTGIGLVLGLLLARCHKNNSARGVQIALFFAVNLALCEVSNFIVFRRFLPAPGTNIWPNGSMVNCLIFIVLAVLSRATFFFWMAALFLVLGIVLSYMPYEWSCITYGVVWTLFLVFMGCCFRWLERPPPTMLGRESGAGIATGGAGR